MLGICAATVWEIHPVLRSVRDVRRMDLGGVRAWRGQYSGGTVVVFRTGIGLKAATQAAETAIACGALTALINTGVAGGLVTSLTAGDLVVPEILIAPGSPEPTRLSTDASWTQRLRAVAAAAGLTTDAGPVVTWPDVLSTAAEKHRAAALYGATAVEMEGSALAAIAARRNIPFVSVRVILDDANTHLPRFSRQRHPPPDAAAPTGGVSRPRLGEKISSFLTLALALQESRSALSRFFRVFGRDIPLKHV